MRLVLLLQLIFVMGVAGEGVVDVEDGVAEETLVVVGLEEETLVVVDMEEVLGVAIVVHAPDH